VHDLVKFKETNPDDWLILLDRIITLLGVKISFKETPTHRNYSITTDNTDESIYITVKKDK